MVGSEGSFRFDVAHICGCRIPYYETELSPFVHHVLVILDMTVPPLRPPVGFLMVKYQIRSGTGPPLVVTHFEIRLPGHPQVAGESTGTNGP